MRKSKLICLLLLLLGIGLGVILRANHDFGWYRPAPPFLADLPGDRTNVEPEMRDILQSQFPPGSDLSALLSFLSAQGLRPDWGIAEREHGASSLRMSLFSCPEEWRVTWITNVDQTITSVSGSYVNYCD